MESAALHMRSHKKLLISIFYALTSSCFRTLTYRFQYLDYDLSVRDDPEEFHIHFILVHNLKDFKSSDSQLVYNNQAERDLDAPLCNLP